MLFDVALPNPSRGHGRLAIAWDPGMRRWLVAGEQMIATGSISGSAHTRLFTLWLGERGQVVEPQTYLADTDAAVVSDWGNPLVRAGDHFALVWSRVSQEPHAVIAEIAPKSTAVQLPLANINTLLRGVVAWTPAGYVVAGGEDGTRDVPDRRVFMTTVRDGQADVLRYVSTPQRGAGEPVLATDGTRIAIAWHEDQLGYGHINHSTVVRAGFVESTGVDLRVQPPPPRHHRLGLGSRMGRL